MKKKTLKEMIIFPVLIPVFLVAIATIMISEEINGLIVRIYNYFKDCGEDFGWDNHDKYYSNLIINEKLCKK